MAKKATLGGKPPQTGKNVSHSHRRTSHQWLVNMQERSLYSATLGTFVRLSLPSCVLRTIDHVGGLDIYLLTCPPDQLERPVRQLQKLIGQRQAAAANA
ncbi:50S ribosomal protein L28 [Candidatus Magnetaquicoccus inordinatus]|uniref:50S ribosomal protein L28 n=1 Tax=Candidatus Magnetaquicoccus inordinatus TaxID=2496818 RepID=UPI00102AC449|nr:50S ribosomal protein L28 [Candidatus Magnetaquicoccus inordinatus]